MVSYNNEPLITEFRQPPNQLVSHVVKLTTYARSLQWPVRVSSRGGRGV